MSAVSDIPDTRFRLSVEQYHRMGEAGILREDDRVELIDGELIRMAPIGSLHGGLVSRLTRLLVERLSGRAIVSPQNPVILDAFTEPQPDLCVLRWRDDDYMGATPVAADTLLVIEVADSSLRYDCDVKLRFYAGSGIPEVWIVDAQRRHLLVYRDPVEFRYRSAATLAQGNAVECAAAPQLRLEVGELFGS